MMRLRVLIVDLLMIATLYAQTNLEIIDYFKAVKIISAHKYNLLDTAVIAIVDKGISKVPIEVTGMHKGFYIVQVSSNQTTKSIKLIIQ